MHLCSEDLLHLLYVLGIKAAYTPLLSVGISAAGKRYFYNGKLFHSTVLKPTPTPTLGSRIQK